MTRSRLAVAAALAVGGGAATMLTSLVATPGPWWVGYVSEAGTAGLPYAVPYRIGLVVLAAGVALLGAAIRPSGLLAVEALAVASLLAGVSGAVPCTDRCPLPPYEPTTVADVVHAGASVLGMVILVGAMAALALTGPRSAIRRLSAAAVLLMVPLGAALGVTMLVTGRGTLGAVLERIVIAVAVLWLITTALLVPARHVARNPTRTFT